jgi:hypothetical protein
MAIWYYGYLDYWLSVLPVGFPVSVQRFRAPHLRAAHRVIGAGILVFWKND